MAAKPITPSQAKNLKLTTIPDFVIEVFNELIVKEIDNGHANISLKQAVTAVLDRMEADYESMHTTSSDLTEVLESLLAEQTRQELREKNREKIFYEKWLDIEPIFRKAGWKVEFDRPAYNENYEANWNFSSK